MATSETLKEISLAMNNATREATLSDVDAINKHKVLQKWLCHTGRSLESLEDFWKLCQDYGIDLSPEDKTKIIQHYINSKKQIHV